MFCPQVGNPKWVIMRIQKFLQIGVLIFKHKTKNIIKKFSYYVIDVTFINRIHSSCQYVKFSK